MKILLASPRGFCAGVDRAILIVEKALEHYGKPVYVRHEIVHNRTVVEDLRRKGAIFVEELDEVPPDSVVVFSAHGVPKSVYEESERRLLLSIDATCPLVKKVHSAVQRHDSVQVRVILIGHEGHPEVIGTMGQLAPGEVVLVSSPEDVEALDDLDDSDLAYTTQTTLSMDDTRGTIEALKRRFPRIKGPEDGDLCYATTNRQRAVHALMPEVDMLLVIGSANSSNSTRLCEIGARAGKPSHLIDGPQDLRPEWFEGIDSVGISSGASAPEYLVQDVIAWFSRRYPSTEIREVALLDENVHFPLPKQLAETVRA